MVGRREFISFSLLSVAGFIAGPSLPGVAGVSSAYAENNTPNGKASEDRRKVAVIQPVFTNTAYSSGGFYDWFRRYAGQDNVTDLNGLDLPVTMDWGFSRSLGELVNSTALLNKVDVDPFVVTDLDIHGGRLFEDGRRKYSYLVIGHSEYVTSNEYNQLREFVSSGGTLVFLDGNALYAEVDYYVDAQGTKRVRLRKGHGWEVLDDGRAVKSVNSRWRKENLEWIGSDYFGGSYNIAPGGAKPEKSHPIGAALAHNFGDKVFGSYYTRREDTVITNPEKVEIIARFNGHVYDEAPGGIFASYTKRYGKGRVFHFGGFGDDVILNDPHVQFLLTSMINYRRRAERVKASVNTFTYEDQNYEYDYAHSNGTTISTVKVKNLGKTNLNLSGWKILEYGKLLAVLTDKTVIAPYETLLLELQPRETNNPLFLYDNHLHFVCQLETEVIEEDASMDTAT
ncbi:MAG: DUF4350 domain-containing protein [Thaumarchaeota archaeon]|nr:DUF4350 domain-containing protein [Nitrososphaerota archaeon]MCL5317662.1 DUF4350 domain-containing protein [Nitrososphaerota archaeon]